jgi:hypothetical protein
MQLHRLPTYLIASVLVVLLSLTFTGRSAAGDGGASISLAKTVGTLPGACAITDLIEVPAGTEVTYCYTVTNTGDVTFNLHTLVDSELGLLLVAEPVNLPPGASHSIFATATINATTVNTATWTASSAYTDVAQDTDTATVIVTDEPPVADIEVVHTVGTEPGVCAATDEITVVFGTEVTYCVTVTNTGNVTLTEHIVLHTDVGIIEVDEKLTLAPGESASVTESSTVPATVPQGADTPIVHIATWTASAEGVPAASDSDEVTINIIPPTAITLGSMSASNRTLGGGAVLLLLTASAGILLWHRTTREWV